MDWLGSLMSQVLQWTQFCALITKTRIATDQCAARKHGFGEGLGGGAIVQCAGTIAEALTMMLEA